MSDAAPREGGMSRPSSSPPSSSSPSSSSSSPRRTHADWLSQPPLLYAAVAGGLGGGIADVALHGLDTVKIRMQGQASPPRYHGMLQTARTILREEGLFRGLYSGATVAFLGSVPSTMFYFASYEVIKRALQPWAPDSIAHLTAGGFSDFLASALVAPWEVVKTRLQLQGRYNNPLQLTKYNYRSWPHALVSLYRYEGLSALFHGFGATCLRDAPFSAVQFAIYEKIKQTMLHRSQRGPHATTLAPGSLTTTESLLSGAIAGTIAGAVTTPLDVIKTRLQTDVAVSGSPLTRRIVRVTQQVYGAEGMRGMFRGLLPRIIWTLPQSSIMFVVYEEILSFMLLTFPPSPETAQMRTSVSL